MNPLQARTFGIWTLTSAVVRFYAAYNITNKLSVLIASCDTPQAACRRADMFYLNPHRIYDMALFTYLFAFFHFGSEILIFRTTKIGVPVLSPVIVSSKSLSLPHTSTATQMLVHHVLMMRCIASTLAWMLTQYDFYVKA